MNKILILITILTMAQLSVVAQEARIIHFQGPSDQSSIKTQTVYQGHPFRVTAHLTVDPKNYQKWTLVSCEPFTLTDQKFSTPKTAHLGSVGNQLWFFKADTLTDGRIIFEREINGKKEQHIMNIKVIKLDEEIDQAFRNGCACDFGSAVE